MSSCSKDDDINNEKDKPLIGSVWEQTQSRTLISFSFENSDLAIFTKTGKIESITMNKYSCNHPNVIFLPLEKSFVQLNGVIYGNTMIVKNPSIHL